MNKREWLDTAIQNREKLASLLNEWHPVNLNKHDFKITAPNAERACEVIRSNIRRNSEGNPAQKFYEALDHDDVSTIVNLLTDAWFGVPESTSCWRIEGFREAVDLLDEIPDND